jgi:hypothetical protein
VINRNNKDDIESYEDLLKTLKNDYDEDNLNKKHKIEKIKIQDENINSQYSSLMNENLYK